MIRSVAETPAKYGKSAKVPASLLWPLSVEQYHEMLRNGIIVDGEPIELLEGRLVCKMGKNPPHCVATGLIHDALARVIPSGEWFVSVQDPVTTADSEPEPDVSVVRGNRRQFLSAHPAPKDAVLIVEVAESSLDRDETLKKRVYAHAQVPVYWIVNLNDRTIEVYTEPTAGRREPTYKRRHDYGADDTVPVVLAGKTVGRIAVRDVLP
jgi:Uma2 family endonuclease